MDSNNKLFKYNFIKKISTSDVDSVTKAKYQKFHEDKHGKQNLKSDSFSKIQENNINYRKENKDRGNTSIFTKKSIISIDSRIRDYEKFPHAHDFVAPFGKSFKDVKSIRLISTEIPNSDQVFKKEPAELQNNIFYWQNIQDKNLNYINDVQFQRNIPDIITLNIPNHNIKKTTIPITLYNSKLTDDINITGISTGVTETTITLAQAVPADWLTGHSVIFTLTDSVPNINGSYIITSIVGSTFTVDIASPITIAGTTGNVVNNTIGIDGTYIGYIIDSDTISILYKGTSIISGTTSVDLGYPLYTVEFKPGNYTATSLTDQIEYSINFVKRSNNAGQYHFFEVNVNLDTDVITFDSVITKQLGANPIATVAASEIIYVASSSHGLKTGDRVKIIDARAVGGISSSVLSGDFIVTVIDANNFTYEVNTRASESTTGGGNTVKTGVDAPFRFLLDTENTLVQYKTGFADEDSTDFIGVSDPFTTKAISVSNLEIIGDYLRITTVGNHDLEESTILNITNISTSDPCEITVSTPHNFEKMEAIEIRDSNSSPNINGSHTIIPTGVYTFTIDNKTVFAAGNEGQVLFNGDKVALSGIRTTPRIIPPYFYVENITSPTVFDVKAFIYHFDVDSVPITKVRTSQVFVNHPDHGFNLLNNITSFDGRFVGFSTDTSFNYSGAYHENISVIDVPSVPPAYSNALDILLTNHGLVTSDEITIINSFPNIDGVYKVQFISSDIIRINYTHTVFTGGYADIFTGEKINIAKSNSLPKIDGYWYVVNTFNISSISIGIDPTIILETPANLSVGDTISFSGTDCNPVLEGEYLVKTVTSPTEFKIDVLLSITSSGTTGKALNKTSGLLYTDLISEIGIIDISIGVTETTITLDQSVPNNWLVGHNVTFMITDSTPNINGSYNITSISGSTFTVDVAVPITIAGTTGKVVNNTIGIIVSPGDYAILGRTQEVIFYRTEAEEQYGDNLGGIQISEFNSRKRVVKKIIDKDNYMMNFDNVFAKKSITKGGPNVRVSSELHGYRSIQANTNTGTKDGDLFRTISLEGENYVYLVIPGFDGVSTGNASINNVFAKIVLTESPGLMCFDSFVSAPLEFDPPLNNLDYLRLKIIDYAGYPFNFNDLNYSLSFEVVELVERLDNTNMMSNASTKLVLAGSESRRIPFEKKTKQ